MGRDQQLSSDEKIQLLRKIIEEDDYQFLNQEFFESFLDDPDPQVRGLAIEGLWNYPDPALIDRLIDMAAHDPEESVRCRAISILGRYIYEGEMADYDFDWGELESLMREGELPQEDFLRVKEFLLSVYDDPTRSLDERRFAVEALSFHSDPRIIEIIEEAYAHPDVRMKQSAIFGMGRSGLVHWTDIILKELHSPVRELQLEAIRAAGECGLPEAGKALWRLTYSDDREIKMEAIWSLGQTGWEGAFARLEELSYLGDDPEVQELAEAALDEWLLFSGLMEDMSDEEKEEENWL